MRTIRPIFLLVIFFLRSTSANPKVNAAKQVLNIVNNPDLYDAAILPKEEGPIQVGVKMHVAGIEIDDFNMLMNLDLTLTMTWRDQRLQYSEPGVETVRFVDYKKFWIPDPFFTSSVKTVQTESIQPDAFISIGDEGNITLTTRINIDSKCIMDLKRFPHDQQVCVLQMTSFGFTTEDIHFLLEENSPFHVSRIILIPNYDLVKFTSDYCNVKSKRGLYSCLMFSLTLKRNFSTYYTQWYRPCIWLVVIGFVSVLLPSAELLPRLLLSFGSFLTLIAIIIFNQAKHRTAIYSTPLDLFILMSLSIIFLTCVQVVFSYMFHLKNKGNQYHHGIPDPESLNKLQKQRLGVFIIETTCRLLIIGLYLVFMSLYFTTYCSKP